jgi:PAS domain S-box-containing protein
MTLAQHAQFNDQQVGEVMHAPGAHDLMHRGSNARALGENAVDLRLLLDSAAEGFCSIDKNGAVTLCNASFLRMTGFERDQEVIGKDFHRLIHHSRADGSPYPRSDCPVLKVAQTGIPAHGIDDVFYRTDGTCFPVEYWAQPVARESSIEGAVCTFVDITERKQAEAQRRLLNHELAHRVKNTLAVVQAIVDQTLRHSDDPQHAVRAINERLVALSRAHEVLTQTQWDGAAITDVVKSGIAVYGSDNSRIRIEGPQMDVGPNTALALTMALHELCTNATKYGSLSNDTGIVVLDWTLGGGGADAAVHLRWKERGGPPVTAPARQGFGSRIIHEYCRSQLGGDEALLFEPDGVKWTLNAPLSCIKT